MSVFRLQTLTLFSPIINLSFHRIRFIFWVLKLSIMRFWCLSFLLIIWIIKARLVLSTLDHSLSRRSRFKRRKATLQARPNLKKWWDTNTKRWYIVMWSDVNMMKKFWKLGVPKRGQASRRASVSAPHPHHIDEHERQVVGEGLHGLDQGCQGEGAQSLRTSAHADQGATHHHPKDAVRWGLQDLGSLSDAHSQASHWFAQSLWSRQTNRNRSLQYY